MNIKPIFFYLFSFLTYFSCVMYKPKPKITTQNFDFLIEQGNKNWANRNDSIALAFANHFIGLAHKKRPDNFSIAILYSQILYTRGLFFPNPNSNDSLFQLGLNTAKNAVLNHPDFIPIYNEAPGDTNFKLISALALAPRTLAPALYWWAANKSHYIFSKPVIERLDNREVLEVLLHRIIAIDPDYYFSGAYRIFGMFYSRIPGVELEQSNQYFSQTLSQHPMFLGNKVLMAEYYHQKKGNREQFFELLNEVIDSDINLLPEAIPENIYYKQRAKYLISMMPTLFE